MKRIHKTAAQMTSEANYDERSEFFGDAATV